MPRPERTISAAVDTFCGLCRDRVAAGDFLGRLRPPERPYEVMGWLCRHCCYDRRARPRRGDVVLRLFHARYVGAPVCLNAPEPQVLHDWLTEDPAARTIVAWKDAPLEGTLQRLEIGVTEAQEEVWLALPTTITVLEVLTGLSIFTGKTDPATRLVRATAAYSAEWTYPRHVEPARFGTGPPRRRQLTPQAPDPGHLGGPFDLNQAVKPTADTEDEDDTAAAAD